MQHLKRKYITHLYFLLFFSFTILTPQYLVAQKSLQNNTINTLLASAQSMRFSDTAAAFKACHQALALAQKNNNGYEIYQATHQLGRIYQVNNQERKALPYFLSLLESQNNAHNSIKCLIYFELADFYKHTGDFQKSFEYYQKSLTVTNQDKRLERLSSLKIGEYYTMVNDFEKATKYLMHCVDLSMAANDVNQLCESYRVLTVVYLKSKNLDLALKSIEKSMDLVEKLDDSVFPRFNVYLSYGNALKESGRYEAALLPMKKGLSLTQAEGNKTYQANACILLADTYEKMDDFKNAEYYYNQCEPLKSSISESDFVAFHYGYGRLSLKKEEYNKSIIYLKQSIILAEKFQKKLTLQRVYTCLSEAYEKKGDAAMSLFYMKKSIQYKDTLYAEENTKRIADAQFKYDVVKSEEQVHKMQQRQFNIMIVATLFALAFLVSFLMYSSSTKNEKNKILTDKNKEIKDKNRQLEESNEILKQFAFASAHDLKEPLRGISGFVNILQKRYMKDAPAEAHEYMNFVTAGVKRMENLLNALLEFSSVLTNENIPSKENNIPQLLKAVLHNHQNLINDKKAVIQYPSVFPIIFMGEAHLKQLLSNLLNNALKFSNEQACVEIGFQITQHECIIFVKDEGVGMDESYSDKVFKLFQRLDRVTHKESVGIGLTICKNIVDKYSGRLWFESVVDKGTTFYMAFPIHLISNLPSSTLPPQYFDSKSTTKTAY
jgi:signal transduction histidine kinase